MFWPFYEECKKRIQDSTIRNHLLKYLRCYVGTNGTPVESVTICTHGNLDFRPLSDQEYKEIRSAVDSLIFSTIAPQTIVAVRANNKSMGPPSSERFQLITQNFKPESDDIAVRAGSVLHGGWKIGEIVFPRPWTVGGSFGDPDDELVRGFNGVLGDSFSPDTRERIFRSLEWFRFAHAEGEEVSLLSKVVMMAIAFEVILQVPKTGHKKRWIADRLDRWCTTHGHIRETRKVGKGRDQTYSKMAWWSWDFYDLRNAIVHGDAIDPSVLIYKAPGRDWLTHLIVADLVFWECVKRELFSQGAIGEKVHEEIERYNTQSGSLDELPHEYLVEWLLGFRDIHQTLGWIQT